eukprot:Skav224832  [mRNA]  locus=scaffold3408:182947:193374:+ [translate_table: standard]
MTVNDDHPPTPKTKSYSQPKPCSQPLGLHQFVPPLTLKVNEHRPCHATTGASSATAAEDLSWPSAAELAKCEEIRKNCAAELAALPVSPRDVVGDIRVCRYLRFFQGDHEASAAYAKFLQYRVDEKIDVLREAVIDLNLKDYTKWLELLRFTAASVMSPYTPHFVPGFTETQDGHFVIFTSPGSFKPNEFVSKRPACHTLEIDCKELGNETLPVFVPEVRKFAQDNLGKVMSFYCEQDILLLVVNAPFMVRAITAFATTFMAKRQSNRIKVMGAFAGSRPAEDVPFYKPLLYQDENRLPGLASTWMYGRRHFNCERL